MSARSFFRGLQAPFNPQRESGLIIFFYNNWNGDRQTTRLGNRLEGKESACKIVWLPGNFIEGNRLDIRQNNKLKGKKTWERAGKCKKSM